MITKIKKSFTISRHAELVSASHAGFTLAEVLITLMVIGVVAVLVIPAFVTNVKDQTLNGQRKTANMKLLEGFRQMRVDGKLQEKYPTTEAFVNEMKNYFKMNAVCDSDNLTNCFPGSYVSNALFGTGETNITITGKKNPSEINTNYKKDDTNFYDNFMGIKFADGVSMIIAVKPNCEGPSEGDSNIGKIMVSELAKCFAYYYDVNGNQSPNKKGKDIIANIGATGEDAVDIGISAPMTYAECQTFTAEYPNLNPKGCYNWPQNGKSDADYYIGAVKTCEDQGMRLPKENELYGIAEKLYNARGNNQCFNRMTCTEDDIDKDLWYQLSGSEFFDGSCPGFWYDNSKSILGNNTAKAYVFCKSSLRELSMTRNNSDCGTIRTLCVR